MSSPTATTPPSPSTWCAARVQIELDADVENPESRTFARDPVAEVLADRGTHIAAILTIARAYRVAGMPGKLTPRLSFEEWSDNVRSALVWLGWPDPDESIKTVRAADPISAKLHGVIAAWAADLTVGKATTPANWSPKRASASPISADRIRPGLWDALFAVAGNKAGQLEAGTAWAVAPGSPRPHQRRAQAAGRPHQQGPAALAVGAAMTPGRNVGVVPVCGVPPF